jgi:SAM-dependent methyltransferase
MFRSAMGNLTEQEEQVSRYYDEVIFEAETTRLEQLFPVEFAVTARHLERWIPERAAVAEVGVGGGHYSELLARRGCHLHLVDVSGRLLDAACARLQAAGLQGQIIGAHQASATNLECLPAAAFDAVLLLGPLYHLCTLEARQRAVREASRVLRSGGLLLAAGINRLAYLRDLFREAPERVVLRRAFHAQYLQDGNLNPEMAPPIGLAHLTTVAEFRRLFTDYFEELILVGVESFTGPWQQRLARLPSEAAATWLELVEQTSTMAEAVGLSDHFLYVGKSKQLNAELGEETR